MFTSLKLCTITPLGMCVTGKKKLQQTKQNGETMQKTPANCLRKSVRFNFMYIIVSSQMRCFSYPKKTADIPRRQHWFPLEITSEKRSQRFHTDDASLPGSDWLEICFNQPHRHACKTSAHAQGLYFQ